jgi:hypothetical protein
MSDINVSVTNAGSSTVTASSSGTYTATVGNGGAVNVSLGTVSPGNATVVSGTLQIGKVVTLSPSASATAVNVGTAYAAVIDLGLPQGQTGATGAAGPTPTITASATTLSAGSSATVTTTTSDGGAKVALAFGIPAGAAGSGGGASLSDATPAALGTAAAGTSSTASRSDHVHATPVISYTNLTNVPSTFAPSTHTHTASQVTDFATTAAAAAPVQTVAGRTGNVVISASDVVGLSDALSNVSVDVIDGGDYVGVVVNPTPTITITAQPSSQSVSISSANEVSSTLPSGTWGPISRVNSQWITSGYQSTQADYLAVSTDGSSWTKRYGLPSAGQWSAVQYQNGVYATQAGSVVAYSSDATTWTGATFTYSRGSVFGAGGKFLRVTQTGLFTSTDAATWTQTATNTSSSASFSFAYAGGTWFAADYTTGVRVSTDATTWSSSLGSSTGNRIENAVAFGSDVYVGRYSNYPMRYSGGSITGAYPSGVVPSSYGGQFATNGSVLVLYSYVGKIFTSTNGTTWVERTLPTTIPSGLPARLFYSGGTFALILEYAITSAGFSTDPGTIYFTSTNGSDWTQQTRTYATYRTIGDGSNGSYVGASDGYLASHNGSAFSYIQIGASTAVASLSVSAYLASGTLTFQWQLSTDAGTTWANVSGATSATLSLSGLTTADNGKRYRCVVSATGVTSVTTNSATLTVT